MKTLDKQYLTYLQNLRNDFYNRGKIEIAEKVQGQINELLSNSIKSK
jgi:hypothetical protein